MIQKFQFFLLFLLFVECKGKKISKKESGNFNFLFICTFQFRIKTSLFLNIKIIFKEIVTINTYNDIIKIIYIIIYIYIIYIYYIYI